jgi:hypothetical protein
MARLQLVARHVVASSSPSPSSSSPSSSRGQPPVEEPSTATAPRAAPPSGSSSGGGGGGGAPPEIVNQFLGQWWPGPRIQWNPDLAEYAAGGFPGARPLVHPRTRLVELTPDASGSFGLELADSCEVTAVTAGSAAARAHICVGMEICGVDGAGCALKSDVVSLLDRRQDPSRPVVFGIFVPETLASAEPDASPRQPAVGAAAQRPQP